MTNKIDDNVEKIRNGIEYKSSSKIFRRNRSMGYVSNRVPALTRYILGRKDTLITTCVGRSFQVYTTSHFRLLHVSSLHPDDITAMATDRAHTYVASDKCIYAWRTGKHISHIYRGHKKNVHLLLPFRSHLIAVDESNCLKVWDIYGESVYLDIQFQANEFLITAIAHPPTYVNKILLGSQQGQLQLWNIKDNRLVYTFSGQNSRVTCIEPAPALDVAAVGHQNGAIILLNLKFDEILMQFKQDWGPILKISFRTDGADIMVTSSSNGFVAFWNLEEKKVIHQLEVHEDAVTTTVCYPNEPIMLTTSPDNSMKLWIFDMPDGGARLLRIREGHIAPPVCIRYHGSLGQSILSAGEDSTLRVFCILSESLNKSMGKASYNRKTSKKKNRFETDNSIMPPIIEFTAETTRDKEWDNIAAVHSGIIQATTWSFNKCKMGEHRLIPEKYFNKNRTDFKTLATTLILTHCGNFVIIGYSSGEVERFNMQSGIHRATYGNPAHKSAIRGLASDNLNQIVVTGCLKGFLRFWPFKDKCGRPTTTLKFSDGIELMRFHRESAMIAVALDTFFVCVVDMDSRAVVRKFEGHSAKINDLTFSPDSRWLITASMDTTIKVWDIPSSYLIDHFKMESPCISLSMSPTGDFLATAHINCLGIYLWSNKTLFNQISLRSINPNEEPPMVGLPSHVFDDTSSEFSSEPMDVDSLADEDKEGNEVNLIYETPNQLSSELITMSTVAASRWQTLLDLELIKKRNKPKTLPTTPKQAPFFLPTIPGLEIQFDLSNKKKEVENSHLLKVKTINNLTKFGIMLEETKTNQDFEKCVEYLKQLGPSMIDFEIKCLSPYGGGTILAMAKFLNTIEYMFRTKLNFELAQSYLSVFLKVNALDFLELKEVIEALKKVYQAQETAWKIIETKLMFGMGVVEALRNYVQ